MTIASVWQVMHRAHEQFALRSSRSWPCCNATTWRRNESNVLLVGRILRRVFISSPPTRHADCGSGFMVFLCFLSVAPVLDELRRFRRFVKVFLNWIAEPEW